MGLRSWRLFSVCGIPVFMHWTFLIFPLGFVLVGGWMMAQWAGLMIGVPMLLVVMSCGLTHELAHCLVARRFGCGTRRIVMIPFGMVAALDHIPREPAHEFLIAVAGPATNAVLAGVCYVGAKFTYGADSVLLVCIWAVLFLLMTANVVLAVFNLAAAILPADGGRILRATLFAALRRWSHRGEHEAYVLATTLAVRAAGWPLVAVGIAIMLSTGLLLPQFFLLLPLLGAAGEAELYGARECPERCCVRDTLTFLPVCDRKRHDRKGLAHAAWGMEMALAAGHERR